MSIPNRQYHFQSIIVLQSFLLLNFEILLVDLLLRLQDTQLLLLFNAPPTHCIKDILKSRHADVATLHVYYCAESVAQQ